VIYGRSPLSTGRRTLIRQKDTAMPGKDTSSRQLAPARGIPAWFGWFALVALAAVSACFALWPGGKALAAPAPGGQAAQAAAPSVPGGQGVVCPPGLAPFGLAAAGPESAAASGERLASLNAQLRGPAWGNVPSPSQASLAGRLLAERKAALLDLMAVDPEAALAGVLPEPDRQRLLAESSNCVETPAVLAGRLQAVIADQLRAQQSATVYWLVAPDGQRVRLHIAGAADYLSQVGAGVQVSGLRLDDELLLDGSGQKALTALRPAATADVGPDGVQDDPGTVGVQSTLVLLTRFMDTPVPALTAAQLQQTVFGRMKDFYAEASYGRMSIGGQVVGPLTLALNRTCDIEAMRSASVNAAVQAGVDITRYHRVILIVPYQPEQCNIDALGQVGGGLWETPAGLVWMSFVWEHDETDLERLAYVLMHEYGHNLGLDHSNALNCGTTPIATSGCQSMEYGDWYDVMGTFLGHFNAAWKDKLGWLTASDVITVTTSGSYTIGPLETPSGGMPKALKIQRAPDDYMYVEYRQPIGFDSAFVAAQWQNGSIYDGALVHLHTPDPHYSTTATQLVWASSFDQPDGWPQAVLAGRPPLYDPVSGTTVGVTGRTSAALTVHVSLGRQDWTPPALALVQPAQGATLSGLVTLSATASDASGIQKVEFRRVGFYADPLLGTATAPPYTITWDSARARNGYGKIYAVAYDRAGEAWGTAGNYARTPDVAVNLSNPGDPGPHLSATLVAPTDGSNPTSPVTFEATIESDEELYQLYFGIDGVGTCVQMYPTPPYKCVLPLPAGEHEVHANAFAFDNWFVTPTIHFTVRANKVYMPSIIR
jgi:hypothetical protein